MHLNPMLKNIKVDYFRTLTADVGGYTLIDADLRYSLFRHLDINML